MKILFFVSSLNAGGAERVASTLANAWAQRGDEVMLVPTYLQRHTPFYPLDARIRLEWLRDHVGPWPAGLLSGPGKWLAMRRRVHSFQPDVIVSFLTNVNVNVLLATLGMKPPVVVCERTDPAHSDSAGRVLAFLRRLLYRRADCVVMQTQSAAASVRSLVPGIKALAVVPNPLPPELAAASTARLQPRDSTRPHIAAMGRLVAAKQFDVLINTFAELATDFPDWDLKIWGEGPERAALESQIQALGLRSRIVLPGRTDAPWKVMSDAQAFAMVSRVEGFPNVLLEAMALGVPAMAIDCPSGPAELSAQGRDALLVPMNDAAALTDALRCLLSDAGVRTRLAQQAQASVRARYGLPTILNKWDRIFADLRTSSTTRR